MKKLFLFAFFSIVLQPVIYGQSISGFGFKAGLNYNKNGTYLETKNSIIENPDRNIGFHFGLFSKFGEDLYCKPEIVYTNTKSDYTNKTFEIKKIDIPVLVGTKIIGPISVFGGPSFQYIIDTEFNSILIDNIEKDFSFGLNIGIGFNFNKIGIDFRYERGLTQNEATFLENNNIETSRIDTRPDQFILSLSCIL